MPTSTSPPRQISRAPSRFPSGPVLLGVSLTLLLAVGLGSTLWRGTRDSDGSRALADPRARDEVAGLRDEIKLLRRQVQLQAMAAPAPLTGAGREGSPLRTGAAPGAAPSAEEVAARDRRHFAAIDRKLAAEPIDPSWAPATEQVIAATLRQPAFGDVRLLSASCHATLCRFEVSHGSLREQRRFGSLLLTRLPALPSGSMHRGEGQELHTIVYVAREGHRIPRDGEE